MGTSDDLADSSLATQTVSGGGGRQQFCRDRTALAASPAKESGLYDHPLSFRCCTLRASQSQARCRRSSPQERQTPTYFRNGCSGQIHSLATSYSPRVVWREKTNDGDHLQDSGLVPQWATSLAHPLGDCPGSQKDLQDPGFAFYRPFHSSTTDRPVVCATFAHPSPLPS